MSQEKLRLYEENAWKCSLVSPIFQISLIFVVYGNAGLDAGPTTPRRTPAPGVGRESTPDESRLFAGVGALSTWAVMRMTDSGEFQFYARRAPRRAGEIAEKCSAATGRKPTSNDAYLWEHLA